MVVFSTADTHFGHTNIIRHSNRPFENVHEMDEALIANWNKVIKQTDTVYHLGDIAVLRPERTREILDRLKGKIYLICGNHERSTKHTNRNVSRNVSSPTSRSSRNVSSPTSRSPKLILTDFV